ncbi:hypothetical protein C6I20_09580 [Aeromicrobium sp. A1-2]|nr:hypothetical protein C6I20_09580 [Aeromicrobium sp. A1-2]
MHACADAMPEIFRYDDVRAWFEDHFPEVNEATIRAHLIGLTEGGRAKHVQFAHRSPVFRRVARGEYAAIPISERGEEPTADLSSSSSKLKMRPEPPGPSRKPLSAAKSKARTKKPKTKSKKAAGPMGRADEPGTVARGASDDGAAAETAAGSAPEQVTDDEPRTPDIILLGSVGDRANVPAPAKEVFRDFSFQLSRLDAELSGGEWFILSAEHGLVAPDEWMSPDSRTLADMHPDYRLVWASWVVARLQSLVGSLDGMLVRVDAPDAFIGPLFADLRDAGAVISSGSVSGTGRAKRLDAQWTDAPVSHEGAVAPALPSEGPQQVHVPRTNADNSSPISRLIADPSHAVPATDVSGLPASPGLYGWFVDSEGARELNRCLMLPVRPGLIFVGQVGGSSWHSLADPVLNLRDHVQRIQLHGRARASTFRMTLATVLSDHLRMESLEDPALTRWMLEHLSVSAWPSENFGELREVEQIVLSELDPPLNVDHLPASEYRDRLSQMRSALA